MKPTQEPTDLDFVKVAVVIDCEGNIAINYAPKGRSHALHVTVGNTNFDLLDWCLARFGGAIYKIFYKDKRGPEYPPAKRWRIQNREAADLLTKCLPHFIIKRDQAEIAIKFQSTYKVPGERTSESDRLLREKLRHELQALTRRGPKGTAGETAKPEEEAEGNLFAE